MPVCITDDVEIFSLLEKANEDRIDPVCACVKDFEFGENYFLLLFNPSGEMRGCRLYQIKKGADEIAERNAVLRELVDLPGENGFEPLKTAALDLLEKFFSGRNNASLFYDAH